MDVGASILTLVLAGVVKADAYVVDERTMRLLIEDPIKLNKLQERKLHNKIRINKDVLNEFSKYVKNVKVIRSTELMLIAYEFGLMDKYLVSNTTNEDLLDALLWGLKLRGCAISQEEVDSFIELEK